MRLSESGDPPMSCELSWMPRGSVKLLIDFFGCFELTIMIIKEREM